MAPNVFWSLLPAAIPDRALPLSLPPDGIVLPFLVAAAIWAAVLISRAWTEIRLERSSRDAGARPVRVAGVRPLVAVARVTATRRACAAAREAPALRVIHVLPES